MLNQILQTFFLCLAVVILTTGIALSSPFPSGVLIAVHTPDHDATTSQPIPSSQSTESHVEAPPMEKTDLPTDRETELDRKSETIQPAQANPAVPYDPYDYKAIRKMNREIYGEAKGKDQE